MGILAGFLLVVFVIVALLLILMVLIQDEGGDSLGGIFAGSSNSTFGSRTGNVVTRFTGTLGALFIVIALGLTFVYRTGVGKAPEAPAASGAEATATYDWNPSASPSAREPVMNIADLEAAGSPAKPSTGAGQ